MGLFGNKNKHVRDASFIDFNKKAPQEETSEKVMADSADNLPPLDGDNKVNDAEPFTVNAEAFKAEEEPQASSITAPETGVETEAVQPDLSPAAETVTADNSKAPAEPVNNQTSVPANNDIPSSTVPTSGNHTSSSTSFSSDTTQTTDFGNTDDLEALDKDKQKEEKFPYSKYELEQLYMEIGESYCNIHADDPDSELSEKVGIVNVIRQYITDMKSDIMKLCASPLSFLLILLLTASIFVPYFSSKDIKSLAPYALVMLVDLACIILFVQGLSKHMNGIGFTIINIILTLCMIAMYLPILVFFFLGLAMKINGGTDVSTVANYILISTVVAALINWFYWGGLKNVVTTSRTIVTGGLAKWKCSILTKFLLYIELVLEIMFTVGLVCFKTKLYDKIFAFINYFNDYLGLETLTKNLETTLNATTGINVYTLVSSVISIAITFVVILILSRVKEHYKPNTEAEN